MKRAQFLQTRLREALKQPNALPAKIGPTNNSHAEMADSSLPASRMIDPSLAVHSESMPAPNVTVARAGGQNKSKRKQKTTHVFENSANEANAVIDTLVENRAVVKSRSNVHVGDFSKQKVEKTATSAIKSQPQDKTKDIDDPSRVGVATIDKAVSVDLSRSTDQLHKDPTPRSPKQRRNSRSAERPLNFKIASLMSDACDTDVSQQSNNSSDEEEVKKTKHFNRPKNLESSLTDVQLKKS